MLAEAAGFAFLAAISPTALLVMAAKASPVTALVSPQPAVTQHTPGVPVERAQPSAA